jgi:hypothetical protein
MFYGSLCALIVYLVKIIYLYLLMMLIIGRDFNCPRVKVKYSTH